MILRDAASIGVRFELLSSSGSALMAGYQKIVLTMLLQTTFRFVNASLHSLVCVILFLSHNHPLPQNGFLP